MLVDQDECWFSRFAQPQMHAFATVEDNLSINKARELIRYLEGRGRIDDLIKAGRKERPDAPWGTQQN